jgi:hypothetical protein
VAACEGSVGKGKRIEPGDKVRAKELEMNTVVDSKRVCNIKISWKECFKFWVSLAVVVTLMYILAGLANMIAFAS